MRDSQRGKVYKWEQKHLRHLDNGVRLEMPAIERLAGEACFLFGFNPPSIENKHHGNATHWGSLVRLPKWARCTSVVLHEVAHHITHGIAANLGEVVPAHGPLFVRVFFELVCYFFDDVQPAALRKTLTEAKVKIGPAGVATMLTRGERKEFKRILVEQARIKTRRAEIRKLMDAVDADERLLRTERAALTDRVKTTRKAAVEAAAKARAAKAARARARWTQQTQEAATPQGGIA